MISTFVLAAIIAANPVVRINGQVVFKGTKDAGILLQTPPIPGSKTTKTKLERRMELGERLEMFKADVNRDTTGVQAMNVYWATMNVTDTDDAAIVTVMVSGDTTALFFFYRNGKWTVLPEEFAQTGKIAP